EATRDAQAFIEFAGLAHRAHALPDDLNLHQRKFLELARALAARPKLLLLDEVLSGLTPSEINEAIEMVQRIRDRGTTIVFVEHVMRAVMALTDRIVVLNHGVLIAQGNAAVVVNEEAVSAAYLWTAHAGGSQAPRGLRRRPGALGAQHPGGNRRAGLLGRSERRRQADPDQHAGGNGAGVLRQDDL